MDLIETLIRTLIECNVMDIFALSNDTIIEVLMRFEKANFNIHCLYNEENIPIAAGACSAYSNKITVLLLSDGFAVNKTINALIASRIKYCPILCIIIENDQESALALHGRSPKSLKVDNFMQRYGIEQIKATELHDPNQLTASIKQIYTKKLPHILRIKLKPKNKKSRISAMIHKIDINKTMKEGKEEKFWLSKLSPIKELINNEKAVAIVGNQILKEHNSENTRKLLQLLNIRYCVLPSAKSLITENDSRYIGTYYGNLSPSSLITQLKKATHIIKIGVEEYPYDYYMSDEYLENLTNKPDLKLMSINNIYTYTVGEIYGRENITESTNTKDRIKHLVNIKDQEFLNEITSTLSRPSFSPKIIVADVGITCLASLDIKLGPIDGYYSNHASASMGLSLASACGISIAKKTVPIWVLIGDGSIVMALNDLLFLANLNQNINIILLDNQQYLTENLRQKTRLHNMPYIDWQKLSESIGIDHYKKVDTIEKTQAALFESLKVKTTSLIHIILSGKETNDKSILETLKFLSKSENG